MKTRRQFYFSGGQRTERRTCAVRRHVARSASARARGYGFHHVQDWWTDSFRPARVARRAGFVRADVPEHTAREDTIIFPAWHKSLSQSDYEKMGDKFEDIERQQFGHDGFGDAVKQIGAIEQALNVADLAQFTAAAPPKG